MRSSFELSNDQNNVAKLCLKGCKTYNNRKQSNKNQQKVKNLFQGSKEEWLPIEISLNDCQILKFATWSEEGRCRGDSI